VEGAWLGANSALFTVLNPILNAEVNKAVNNLHIPDIDQKHDSVEFKLSQMYIMDFGCNECLALGTGPGFASLTAHGLTTKFHVHVEAKWLFIHPSSTCTPDLEGLDVTAHLSFGPFQNGKPTVQVSEISITIGHISLHCDGFVGTIIDALTWLFQGLVKSEIEKTAQNAVKSAVASKVNEILSKLNLEIPINHDFALMNFNLVPGAASLSSAGVKIGVEGVIVPTANPSIVFPFAAPGALVDNCAAGMVNLGVSLYTFDTALYTFWQAGRLVANLPHAFNASQVALLMPGFAQYGGGPTARINMTVSVLNPAVNPFVTNPAAHSLAAVIPVQFALRSHNNTHFVMNAIGNVGLSVNTTGGATPSLSVGITVLSFSNLTAVSTNVGGDPAIPDIFALLDGVVRSVVLPALDAYLASHPFPFPSLDGFSVSSPQVAFNSNDICIGMDLRQT